MLAADTVPLLQHVPTAMELAADPEELAIIRQLFGSRAQTLINTLLAFDSYFNWYYPLKEESIPLFAPIPIREARAFENMTTAIDMMEMFERISIRNHTILPCTWRRVQGYKRPFSTLATSGPSLYRHWSCRERRDEASGEQFRTEKPNHAPGRRLAHSSLASWGAGTSTTRAHKGLPHNDGHITHQKISL